jgi:hypothetical protein
VQYSIGLHGAKFPNAELNVVMAVLIEIYVL